MSGPRFVEVPADRLVSTLEGVGERVKAAGGAFEWRIQGKERVFDLRPWTAEVGVVRVFTSLANGATVARDCGKDAVRVCVGALEAESDDFGSTGRIKFRPLESGQKILRTAPQGAEDRVGVFLDRLVAELREAFKRARMIRKCPACGKPMARRESKHGPFMGCTGYPACKKTMPAQ